MFKKTNNTNNIKEGEPNTIYQGEQKDQLPIDEDQPHNDEDQLPIDFDEEKSQKKIKLLNQGAYGCVYRPNIECDGNIGNNKYVTKIQLNKDNVLDELSISEIIKKIPNYQYFFAPLIQSCNVSISLLNSENIKDCDLLKDEKKISNQKFLSTKVRYVGNKNIEEYFLSILIIEYLKYIQDYQKVTFLKEEKNLNSYIKNKTYLKTLSLFTPSMNEKIPYFFFENIMIKKISYTYYYLLKAIQKLQIFNIIHFDIKEPNILYDEWNQSPIIIDFGISFDLSIPPSLEKQAKFFYTKKFYIYWCIDIFIINYIVQDIRNISNTNKNEEDRFFTPKLSNDIITKEKMNIIINEFFENLKNYLNSIPTMNEEIILFESKIQNFLTPFIGKKWEELFDFLFKKELYSSWDNYSLAMSYLFISNSVHFLDYNNLFSNNLLKLWKSIIFAIPGERKNIEQTMEEWKLII